MINNIPDVPIQKPKRSNLSSASFVWLIPFFALAIALGVAWQTYANQGRLIKVAFENGAGIVANTTELRYREISVGVVEEVSLSDGLKAVVASIRLNKKIDPMSTKMHNFGLYGQSLQPKVFRALKQF